MEIWHTAAPDATKTTGWLGNYLDATHSESNSLWRAVSVGRELPVSMLASGSFVPAVESVAAYALQTDRKYPKDQANKINAWAALYAQAAAEPGLGAFVGETGGSAYKSSLELAKVSAGYTPQATYPGSAIGNALKLVAQVATSSLGTGIAYVTTGGYDTHSGEVGEQQRLFTELNAGISAFMADIAAHGKANDVVLMTWSEFGRRVQVNASNGTDHGTAGPMFVLGGPVTGGAFGELAVTVLARPRRQPEVHDGLPSRLRDHARRLAGSGLEGGTGRCVRQARLPRIGATTFRGTVQAAGGGSRPIACVRG
jgi:uncharacterized protein (DUF1501 family)